MLDLPELGEGELGSPHLTLAAETVSADQLEPTRNEQKSDTAAERARDAPNLIDAHALANIKMACPQPRSVSFLATYSLISFSLSKGLLGVEEVLLSTDRKRRMLVSLWSMRVRRGSLTVRVLNGHWEGLIFGL